MSAAVDSANLILKLYELRRENVMREARNYFFSFNPSSAQDYLAEMSGPNSPKIRMVTSYWEMACSMVTSGAIDPVMFDASAGEQIIVFGKIEGFLPQLREMMGNPNLFKNLEQVCTSAPSSLERVRAQMARIKAMMSQRASA